MRHLKIEKADNGFATLILDNADESMNLVSDAFIADMEEETAILTEDESVKGVILTSGKKTFMAGADLKPLVQGFGKLTARQAYDFSLRAPGIPRATENSGTPWGAETGKSS